MRISDWSSDVCSSDLGGRAASVARDSMAGMGIGGANGLRGDGVAGGGRAAQTEIADIRLKGLYPAAGGVKRPCAIRPRHGRKSYGNPCRPWYWCVTARPSGQARTPLPAGGSEAHKSELQ